jgi:hypothetical protein
MNPKAANYSASVTEADGSCLFVKKVEGVCHLFRQAQDIVHQDFTASYSIVVGDWAFFHDYIADDYITMRNRLFSVKNNSVFEHNKGPYGMYYTQTPKSFFIDLVVTEQRETLLSALQWLSEVLDSTGKEREHMTFTHITVWNNTQCTGRIPATSAFKNLQYDHMRKSRGVWNFNSLRDIVKDNDTAFLLDLFRDFAVDNAKVDVNLPWYRKGLLRDDHFIVRLEFDNTQNYNIILHQLGALMDKPL